MGEHRTTGDSGNVTLLHLPALLPHGCLWPMGLWKPLPPVGHRSSRVDGPMLGMGRNWWPRLVLLLNVDNWEGISGYAHRAVSGTVSRREGASHWHPFWSPFSSPWCPAPLMLRAFPPAVLHLFFTCWEARDGCGAQPHSCRLPVSRLSRHLSEKPQLTNNQPSMAGPEAISASSGSRAKG